MNLKIIINQIRKVRIDRIECKLKFCPCLDGEFLKLPFIYLFFGTMIKYFVVLVFIKHYNFYYALTCYSILLKFPFGKFNK